MRFFEDSRALDSLRHSDFDSLSAYGEVIDNAIQAEASHIRIRFDLSPARHNYEQINELAFSDNGHGMPPETLHGCLQLGWSSRFNDRSGIGRFGVGMVLGAIHEVQRVDVYSKEKGGRWHHTYVDLQEIENGELDEIPQPTGANVPEKYRDLVDDTSGTLVIWSKYDKQPYSGSKLKSEAKEWIGRTFRYFIWDGIEITIDGQAIPAHDPLYSRTQRTAFPDDPKADEFKDIVFDWPISEKNGEMSEIRIKMSHLPEEFRPTRGSGGSSTAKERRIDENGGISILRNRREVYYGQLPYWTSVRQDGTGGKSWRWEEIDRFWGCEVLFNADLDSDFSVKNIKRGADPSPELKQTIKKLITPTRETVNEKTRAVWKAADEAERDRRVAKDEELNRGPHHKAEQIAKKTATPKSKMGQKITTEEAAQKIGDDVLNNMEADKKAQFVALFQSQPFTIQEDRWRGQTFWEVHSGGGNTLLSYNLSHPFFSEIENLVQSLEEENVDGPKVAARLREFIDLVLISMAKAQSLHDEGEQFTSIGNFIEQLNNQWGMMLSNYVKTWVEERDDV